MELQNFYAQNRRGDLVPLATVYVYESGTTTTVDIFDKSGAAKTNPFNADSNGLVQFRVDNGIYDVRVLSGDMENTLEIQANDLNDAIADAAAEADRAEDAADEAEATVSSKVTWVETLSDLKAIDASGLAGGEGFRITTTGRAGDFTWMAGDQSANVADDPQEGVWVAPDGEDGGGGAWMRAHGLWDRMPVGWFGAVGDGVANDQPAIQAWGTYIVTHGLKGSMFDDGYLLSSEVDLPAGALDVVAGRNTVISGDGIGNNHLIALNGTSVYWEGGILEQCNAIFLYKWSATLYEGLVFDLRNATLRDYRFGTLLQQDASQNAGSFFASFIWDNLDLSARHSYVTNGEGAPHSAFDLLQETNSYPLKYSSFTRIRGANGGQEAFRFNHSGDGDHHLHDFSFENYVNAGTGSDADAHIWFPRSGRSFVTDGAIRDLTIIDSTIEANDTEAFRGGGDYLFMDNVYILNGGGAEAVLALKGCDYVELGTVTIEFSDAYNNLILSTSGASPRTLGVLFPEKGIKWKSLTVINSTSSILDFQGATTGEYIVGEKTVAIDCDTSQAVYKNQAVFQLGEVKKVSLNLEVITTEGNSSKLPVRCFYFGGPCERARITGFFRSSNELLRINAGIGSLYVEADHDGSDCDRFYEQGGGSVEAAFIKGTWSNAGGVNGVFKLADTFLQTCSRLVLDVTVMFDDYQLSGDRWVYFYTPTNSILHVTQKASIWDSSISDGCTLHYSAECKNSAGTLSILNESVDVYQSGANFSTFSSVASSNALQLRSANVSSGTDAMNATIQLSAVMQKN